MASFFGNVCGDTKEVEGFASAPATQRALIHLLSMEDGIIADRSKLLNYGWRRLSKAGQGDKIRFLVLSLGPSP